MTQGRFVIYEGESNAVLINILEECFTDLCTGVPTRCIAVSSNDSSLDTKVAQRNELTREHSSIQITVSLFFP